MKNQTGLLNILVNEVGIKPKMLEQLLDKSKQSIYNYRYLTEFEDLPLSVQIKLIGFAGCESISEFRDVLSHLTEEDKIRIKEKYIENLKILDDQRDDDSETGYSTYDRGELTVVDIGRIGANIKAEIPEKTEEKANKLLQHKISIPGEVSYNYCGMLEEILQKLLENGNDFILLEYLKNYDKNKLSDK